MCTLGGLPKKLNFKEAFGNGYLMDLRHKILYIDHLTGFPQSYIEDGWLADSYMRTIMSTTALRTLKGLNSDDLFLNFDADEIPKPEVIQFLKHFDYPGEHRWGRGV